MKLQSILHQTNVAIIGIQRDSNLSVLYARRILMQIIECMSTNTINSVNIGDVIDLFGSENTLLSFLNIVAVENISLPLVDYSSCELKGVEGNVRTFQNTTTPGFTYWRRVMTAIIEQACQVFCFTGKGY